IITKNLFQGLSPFFQQLNVTSVLLQEAFILGIDPGNGPLMTFQAKLLQSQVILTDLEKDLFPPGRISNLLVEGHEVGRAELIKLPLLPKHLHDILATLNLGIELSSKGATRGGRRHLLTGFSLLLSPEPLLQSN